MNNTLLGGDGNNILNGNAGFDYLYGGLGDDIYVVSDYDYLLEAINQGVDTVRASLSYTLESNIEKLQLTGVADLSATGNELANTLIGNHGNNILKGGDGNDQLLGESFVRHSGLYSGPLHYGAGSVQALFTGSSLASEILDLGTAQIVVNGQTFTGNNQLYVSRRGAIGFGAPVNEATGSGIHQNTDLSSGTEPAFMLAPLWGDWEIYSGDVVLAELTDDMGEIGRAHV